MPKMRVKQFRLASCIFPSESSPNFSHFLMWTILSLNCLLVFELFCPWTNKIKRSVILIFSLSSVPKINTPYHRFCFLSSDLLISSFMILITVFTFPTSSCGIFCKKFCLFALCPTKKFQIEHKTTSTAKFSSAFTSSLFFINFAVKYLFQRSNNDFHEKQPRGNVLIKWLLAWLIVSILYVISLENYGDMMKVEVNNEYVSGIKQEWLNHFINSFVLKRREYILKWRTVNIRLLTLGHD